MTYKYKLYDVFKKYKFNDIILMNNFISEPSVKYTINKYGHIKEFIKLSQKQKEEAYRVISPLAMKFAGIEESYSAIDINGNVYDFEIFLDANFRIINVEKYSDNSKEVSYETKISRNS